jgi:class 3 adenylate cyclase
MTYNDLRSLCKERGLDATGTKVELIARLQANDAPSEEIPISDEAATEASDAPSEEAVSNEVEPEGEVSESENSGEEQFIGEEK